MRAYKFLKAILFVSVLIVSNFSLTVKAEINIPKHSQQNLIWAKAQFESFLEKQKIIFPFSVTVLINNKLTPEEFHLQKNSNQSFSIQAGDSVGAMYGIFELKEQIELAYQNAPLTKEDLFLALKETKQKPFIKLRGDNPFIHVDPLLTNDTKMWFDYIDMLAENRFNFLDLHGGYNKTTTLFPNLLPYYVHIPEFPNVGNKEKQNSNLKNLKQIVKHAHARGVKIGIMNYSTEVDGISDLEKYTSKAIEILLNELPELDYIGFRVGESGKSADFFNKYYLNGIKKSKNPKIKIYTRSWQTTKEELTDISNHYHTPISIEIKYNGEHLGLPYQAIHNQGKSYSYQDYIDPKGNYKIIWQVRANGTHRFWSWMNTDFIRRSVKTFQFGNASAFTLEPHIAYFPVKNKAYYKDDKNKNAYEYIWEKHKPWYFSWGRLSYNPELSESKIQFYFDKVFQQETNAFYKALNLSSKIIPLIFSYRHQGPDHRNFSPETETGAFWVKNLFQRYAFKSGWGTPGIKSFGKHNPLDDRSFISIKEFIKNKVSQKLDGRITPLQVANLLDKTSTSSQDLLKNIKNKDDPRNFILLTDLNCANHMGSYYSERIKGITYLYLSEETQNLQDFQKAKYHLKNSRHEWQNLSKTCDKVYQPLENWLRIKGPMPSKEEKHYTWSSQIKKLNELDKGINNYLPSSSQNASTISFTKFESTLDLIPHDFSLKNKLSGNKITVLFQDNENLGIQKVKLWFKKLPSYEKWKSQTMKKNSKNQFEVSVDFPKEGIMYHIEIFTKDRALNYPNPLIETPFYFIEPELLTNQR